MTIFKDRAQETSSNTPTDTGTVSITLAGATQYNRTFAASGYVTTDDVLVHVYQTNNPDLWCVVPGQFVDTPDRITFTDTDVEDGSSGPGVCPTWTSTVTVGVEMVASLAASASNAEPAGTAAAAITAHDTTSAHAGIVAAQTTAATSKATPVDADEIPLADSAASFALKKLTWANLKATVQSALDALYKLLPSGTSGQTLYHNGTQWVTSNTASLSFDGTTLRPKEIETTGTGGYFATKNGTNYAAVMYGQNNYLSMNASYYAAWSSGGDAIAGHDTYLWRSGVGTLGVRNALGVYPTYTDASNYERLTLTGTAGSNVELKAESAGTGAANIDLKLTPKGYGAVKLTANAINNSLLTLTGTTGQPWEMYVAHSSNKLTFSSTSNQTVDFHSSDNSDTGFSFSGAGDRGSFKANGSYNVYITTNTFYGSGNFGFNVTNQFGSGKGVFGIANAVTDPTTNPTGGGILYSTSGEFRWRTSGGDTLKAINLDRLTLAERSSDPSDPAEGNWSLWMSDGTGAGDDGDIMIKITAGGVTKTATLIDFSTL